MPLSIIGSLYYSNKLGNKIKLQKEIKNRSILDSIPHVSHRYLAPPYSVLKIKVA